MKWLVLVFSLSFFQLASAQNLPPIGAKWHYQVHCMNWPLFFIPCDYISVEVIKDTTIQNKSGIILERTFNGMATPEASLIFVEDSGRIFFMEDQKLKLFFDFNLQIGDTLAFQIPKKYNYYNIDCSDGWDSVVYESIVKDIKIEIIDNIPLRQYHLAPVLHEYLAYWYLNIFSERMLGLYAFLGGGPTICLGGFSGYLRCYEDEDIFYKISQEDCDATDPSYAPDPDKPISRF